MQDFQNQIKLINQNQQIKEQHTTHIMLKHEMNHRDRQVKTLQRKLERLKLKFQKSGKKITNFL